MVRDFGWLSLMTQRIHKTVGDASIQISLVAYFVGRMASLRYRSVLCTVCSGGPELIVCERLRRVDEVLCFRVFSGAL